MSRDLYITHEPGGFWYFRILKSNGQTWHRVNLAFENPTSANWAKYNAVGSTDTANLTELGVTGVSDGSGQSEYQGQFPVAASLPRGIYYLEFLRKANSGDTPSPGDRTGGLEFAHQRVYWDGANIVDALGFALVETGVQLWQAVAQVAAATCGASAGVDGDGNITYKAIANPATNRVTASVPTPGVRASVSHNLPS